MYKIKQKVYARFHDNIFELATIRDKYIDEEGNELCLCKRKKKDRNGNNVELWLGVEDLQPLLHIDLPSEVNKIKKDDADDK